MPLPPFVRCYRFIAYISLTLICPCPNTELFTDRARKSKLATWKAEDNGRSFLGSKDFPPSLVAMALKCDPKGILFGTGEVANPTGASDDATAERARLRRILDERLRGKRILLCSGADDKLVPYECAEDMVDFLRTASETWYRDGDLVVDNRVYDGIGHVFAAPMIQDAVRFLTDTVAEFDDAVNERTGKDAQTLDSKM